MLRCHKCGALISTYDAQGGARIAGNGSEAICPSCAVAVYYERQDASEKEVKESA